MNYRISDLITAINAALNYPAITYDDVSLYLDQCVAEINTTLHTSIRTFKEYLAYDRERKLSEFVKVTLSAEPTGDDAKIECLGDEDEGDAVAGNWYYWVGETYHRKFLHRFVKCSVSGEFDDNFDESSDELFGVYASDGIVSMYKAHAYSDALCLWVRAESAFDVDVTEFLPEDWITLFVIPYVCFKYAVRDGGVASTFAEEMEQGFQQLQEAYDVPKSVYLPTYVDRPAYLRDAKELLERFGANGLNVNCPTRAIYSHMKHPRAVKAEFGSMYDAGGWGL